MLAQTVTEQEKQGLYWWQSVAVAWEKITLTYCQSYSNNHPEMHSVLKLEWIIKIILQSWIMSRLLWNEEERNAVLSNTNLKGSFQLQIQVRCFLHLWLRIQTPCDGEEGQIGVVLGNSRITMTNMYNHCRNWHMWVWRWPRIDNISIMFNLLSRALQIIHWQTLT